MKLVLIQLTFAAVTFCQLIFQVHAKQVSLEGKYQAVYEDYSDGSHKLIQFLETSAGKKYELNILGTNPELAKIGQKIKVKGELKTKNGESTESISLASNDILIMGATGGDNGGTPAPVPNTFGERKVAVIMINFQDVLDEPWSSSQMQDMFFNQASNFYKENSYGQTWLSGSVFGWYTLPVDGSTSCPSHLYEYADSVVKADGIDLSAYDHHVYIIPKTSYCARDSSSVGGIPSKTRIRSADNIRVVTHELGHALGLGHANAIDCEGDVLKSNCKNVPYGDIHDVMGKNFGHFNAFHKEKLGWLNYNQSPPITTVTTDGIYVISPLEISDGKSKALKIWQGADSVSGQNSWYYLEYRQPIGFDSALFEEKPYFYPDQLANGIVIHKGVHNAYYSHMLDMTPDSASSSVYDLQDPVLEVGHSYHDDITGITITPLVADSTGISVSITFDKDGPTTNNSPIANNDIATTTENTSITIDVLANDSDPDGDILKVTNISGVNGSAIINNDNTITYTPVSGFSGVETFNYSVSDGNGASANASVSITVTAITVANKDPLASFSFSCSDLTCSFLDTSTDSDGSIVSRSFNFGDGSSSNLSSITHNYAGEGSYSVTLTVTDNDGAKNSVSRIINVTSTPDNTSSIQLSATLNKNKGTKIVTLKWSGASSEKIRIFKNDILLVTTDNDGLHEDLYKGKATHSYQVCEQTSNRCSPIVINLE